MAAILAAILKYFNDMALKSSKMNSLTWETPKNIDWVMMKNIIGSHLGSHIGFKHPWGTGDASNQLYHVYWLLLSWISERNLWISSPMGLQDDI